MEKYTVDRFEDEKAVLLLRGDESVEKVISRKDLPKGVKEGDILEIVFNSNGVFIEARILEEETKDAREEAKGLLEKLKRKNSGQ